MKIDHIGDRIKKARKSAGLTQKQLADSIGKSFSTVQKYEMNLTLPPVDVINDISKVLGVSTARLLGVEKDIQYIEDQMEAQERAVNPSNLLSFLSSNTWIVNILSLLQVSLNINSQGVISFEYDSNECFCSMEELRYFKEHIIDSCRNYLNREFFLEIPEPNEQQDDG
ncbi:MAG: helix-turn-helix domain-containing protein [Clostridia bacterium]|nr:helix-turn-helix domain-containing protein [Clostridia bacterium]